MRDSLKIAVFAAVLVAACGPIPQKQSADVVPKELIPAGFEQSECHFEHKEATDSGGLTSFGGSASSAVAQQANTGGEIHPGVSCEHVDHVKFERCFDTNGVDHPVEWCKEHQAEKDKPTSRIFRPLCGHADGLLMPCDETG